MKRAGRKRVPRIPVVALALLAAGILGLALVAVRAATAQGPSQIVDRTFVCSTVRTFAGWRDLDILAAPRAVEEYSGVRNTIPAHLDVSSGVSSSDSYLVAVRTAPIKGISETLPAGVYAHARRCAASNRPIPLSSRGLAGPPVAWRKDVECQVRGRVVVRVRAMLAAPAPWRRADGTYVGARRDVVSASLAIRSEATGAAVAYVELARGATRLWHQQRCA